MMNDCIDHQRIGDRQGYGRRNTKHGKSQFLHRLKYCAAHGLKIEDIAGKVVRHACDNPRCINPDHLLLGSVADNNLDRAIRGRNPDAKLTDEQVAEIRTNCRPSRPGDISYNPFSYAAYGKKFGVKPQTIRSVYLGLTFKHLPGARTSGEAAK